MSTAPEPVRPTRRHAAARARRVTAAASVAAFAGITGTLVASHGLTSSATKVTATEGATSVTPTGTPNDTSTTAAKSSAKASGKSSSTTTSTYAATTTPTTSGVTSARSSHGTTRAS